MFGGGSCGCCSCGCCSRDVERNFFMHTILSADETIKHWEAAVDAGKSILWDALNDAIEKAASDTIGDVEIALEKTEQIVISSLNKQFDVIKSNKEAILEDAKKTQRMVHQESEALSSKQAEILRQEVSEVNNNG